MIIANRRAPHEIIALDNLGKLECASIFDSSRETTSSYERV